MDSPSKAEAQRRFIQRRAQELLARVNHMGEEELRWTVRVFADCLSPEQRSLQLGNYSEYWGVEELRRFVPRFIQRYTELALQDLATKQDRPGNQVSNLTDEELQSMSLAEKWELLARDPDGLEPYQLRRELARLFMGKSYDLFHDVGLSEAAVEFPAYHQVREALEAQSDAVIAELLRMVLERAERLGGGTPDEVNAVLAEIREILGRSLGIQIATDQLFADQMARIPLDLPEGIAESTLPDARRGPVEMLEGDIATTFLVLTDLMSSREWAEDVLPLQRQYRSLMELPPEERDALLRRLATRVGDRRVTDFAERYRSGGMVAERKVDPQVWEILPAAERLAMLERDNQTMDAAQIARHLAKIFFSFQYATLFDEGFHTDLLRSPRYQRLVNHLIGEFNREAGRRRLAELTQEVTRLMAQLESAPLDERPARLQEIRTVISTALDLPDELTYSAGKEGRA